LTDAGAGHLRLFGSNSTETTRQLVVLTLAVATGAVGGLGAVVFRLMIAAVQSAFRAGERLGPIALSRDLAVLAPVAGLLLVAVITQKLAREVRGHGVPQILEALALNGGRMRARVGLFGILAPAITIGSGGSVGREGPIALIGGAFGSTLGQLLHLPDRYVALLLACGSAAGIGATFNAPIAGGFFGLEVILGTYSLGAMVPVFLSSVVGVAIFTAIEGNSAVLALPPFHPSSPLAVPAAMVLGALGAAVGLGYTRGLDSVERLAERVLRSPWWRAGVGGLIVGAIGFFLPQVLGVGYPTMHEALLGTLPLGLIALLLVAKYVATMVTIGAGGSGGVFAPSLYLGAMLGSAYGLVLHAVLPDLAFVPQVYAVAGMATVFAAAAQAPFVAITILLEITGDYRLTVLVMAAASVAYFVYAHYSPDSMYTVRLTRRGVRILRGNDVRPIEAVAVAGATEAVAGPVPWATPVREAYRTLTAEHRTALVVTGSEADPDGSELALVDLSDLTRPVAEDEWQAPVGRYSAAPPAFLHAEDSVDTAMRLMALSGAEVLPVAGSEGGLTGIVTAQGLMGLYHRSTPAALLASRDREADGPGDPGAFVTVRLSPTAAVVGRRLADAGLPAEAVVVSIGRDGMTFAPHGGTLFQAGDRVVAYVSPASAVGTVRQVLEGPAR
jgi:chloride channel protein, CIC family